MARLRSFVALLLDSHLRERLAEAAGRLQQVGAGVKWVEPENLHLTLKFLGSVEEQRLPGVEQAIREAAAQGQAFSLSCAGLGAFPNLRRPRVVWAGVRQGIEELARLARSLDERLQALGFERQKRPFAGHITLGRVKSPVNLHKLTQAMQEQGDPDFGAMAVSAAHLMKSTLTPSGPIYSILQEFPLGERNESD